MLVPVVVTVKLVPLALTVYPLVTLAYVPLLLLKLFPAVAVPVHRISAT